jgi:hypothetical protein
VLENSELTRKINYAGKVVGENEEKTYDMVRFEIINIYMFSKRISKMSEN